MMKKFKDLLSDHTFHRTIEFPSVSIKLNNHNLELRFDSKDVVLDAGYTGDKSPWLASLCYLVLDKTLNDISSFSWKNWEEAFKEEQIFWDLRREEEEQFFHESLELLKASLDVFRGREYLYEEASPLVCRCFGVRESDILSYLQKEAVPTLDGLAGVSKAGMGCRTCVPQLKRWLVLHETKKHTRHFKERPIADWLLDIDYHLSRFPKCSDWKMELQSFKGVQVIISFEKDVTQKEEETTSREIQNFLAAALDPDLGFFLRRVRHFSKAKG